MESENHAMTDQPLDPSTALADARRVRHAAALRGADSGWYAPVLGLCLGGMIAAIALPPFLIPLAAAVCVSVAGANYRAWSLRTGLSVTNFQGRRTTLVSLGIIGVYLAAAAAAYVLRFRLGYAWAPLPLGALTGVLTALGSRLWDRAWLAETREG